MFLSPGSRAQRRGVHPSNFGGYLAPDIRGYLGGLTLSNDSVTASSVLDISPGVCADKNAQQILKLPAITKTTTGAWTPGPGHSGMGQGITVSACTWYHVFVWNAPTGTDVYFDTVTTSSNCPVAGAPSRRIGSIRTSSASGILAFTQSGDTFVWASPINEFTTTSPPPSSLTAIALTGVPPSVATTAKIRGIFASTTITHDYLLAGGNETAGLDASVTGRNRTVEVQVSNQSIPFQVDVPTNSNNQVNHQAASSADQLDFNTVGWIDTRGRFA